jgi:hypothetical protein
VSRGFKRGVEETRIARERGQIRDKRSFVSLDGHSILYGVDKTRRREEIYVRAQGRCEGCVVRHYVPWESGEMHHRQGGLTGRCDCLENLMWVCSEFHRAQHVQVRLGESEVEGHVR